MHGAGVLAELAASGRNGDSRFVAGVNVLSEANRWAEWHKQAYCGRRRAGMRPGGMRMMK